MDFLDGVPWERVAANLRAQAEAHAGVEGGVIGAGLGLAATVAAFRAMDRKPTLGMLLAGTAIGIAYGAVERSVMDGEA